VEKNWEGLRCYKVIEINRRSKGGLLERERPGRGTPYTFNYGRKRIPWSAIRGSVVTEVDRLRKKQSNTRH